ncbi:hypothetical protein CDD81_7743 [Ophiocordyceps australis]|uniref:Calcineurin-like phosphoesterase domain-containing protein n=1 Tax=Ophiocordyceps australis TaxID=1399860 RepID=A0A2C5X8W3_9HYPO|nr:hypothetical protein CDD81_7743 [Ophiocordyceps australis]
MRSHSLLPLLALSRTVHSDTAAQYSGPDIVASSMSLKSKADAIWEKLKGDASCGGAEALLAIFKGLAVFGDEPVIKVAQGICKATGKLDADVCDGAIALEGPILADVIRHMTLGSRTSYAFGTTVLGVCGYPDVVPWDVPFPSPKPAGGRPKPSGKKPLKVVHYSDIHIDEMYQTGANADCSKPICCRPYTEADAPGNAKRAAGPFGDHKCDVPHSLEESMYRAINQLVPDAAFSMFTGDIVDHGVWMTSKAANEEKIQNAYNIMNQSLPLIYGTAGNHEAHPVNGFQPNEQGSETSWVYSLLSSNWNHWVGHFAAESTAMAGSYSAKVPDHNLRIISLNTNFYYRDNFYMYRNMDEKDPNNQISWLVQQLDMAEKARENVWLIGHMPLGDADALRDQSNYLDQVFKRYSSTIAGGFFGHTHVDHFEISYADYGDRNAQNAFMMSYIAPSLTPTAGQPAFRVYDVDPETFGVLDSTTYIADMSNADYQTKGPVWTKLYSAKEAYGPLVQPPVTDAKAELTPAFWHQVTEVMEADGSVFDAYIGRKSRGWQVATCRGECKVQEICQLRAGRAQDNCFKPKGGISFTKRDEGSLNPHGEHDECGKPVSMTAFGALTESKDYIKLLLELSEQEIAYHKKAGKKPAGEGDGGQA